MRLFFTFLLCSFLVLPFTAFASDRKAFDIETEKYVTAKDPKGLEALCQGRQGEERFYCSVSFHTLGFAYFEDKKYKAAESMFEKGLKYCDSKCTKTKIVYEANTYLALMNMKGLGMMKNQEKAKQYYKAALDHNMTFGMNGCTIIITNHLAGIYAAQNDYKNAVQQYRTCAKLGSADCQFNLGVLYAYGYGVPQNTQEAYAWMGTAIKQGTGNAAFRESDRSVYKKIEARISKQGYEALENAKSRESEYYESYVKKAPRWVPSC